MATTSPIDSNWQPVKIGAGGWITGIDIAPDGTMVGRTDTYGAYMWNGTGWTQLVTAASMPSGMTGANGVYELRIAASNSNILYMEMGDGIYKSTDKGQTWVKTAFPTTSINPNAEHRMDGQKMAIDPTNPNIVYAGTQSNGLWATHDGGSTWQKITAVPQGTNSDPALTGITIQGSTIYVGTGGSGVFASTDGGATWHGLGGPADVANAAIAPDGSYYAASISGGALWKYSNGSWTTLIADGVHGVAIDPFTPSHVVVTGNGGNVQESRDGGATWSGWNWNNQLESTEDVPWLENSGGYMSSGGLVFDPHVPGKIWQSAGVGVWETTLPNQLLSWNTPVIWSSHSTGIEQLVANDIIAGAGASPIVASWDRAFFEVTGSSSYATSYSGGDFSMGWSLDYASSNSSFIVGLSDWDGKENSGYSADGGHTWQKFATMPSFAGSATGGSIAASTPTNIIWAPAGGYAPVYTLDGGASWQAITLPGKTSWSGFHQGYWLDRTTITADRVQANTFYMYDSASGVYTTRDGGVTWTKVFSGEITAFSQYNAKIESVPGRVGELFFTAGPQSGADLGFIHSTDAGASWQAVAGVHAVTTFGYGAAATPGGPASIYLVGKVGTEYGVWYSTDDGQKWTEIGRYPGGSLDTIKTISGDMDQFGSVYIGFGGSGYAHLQIGSAPVGTGTTTPPNQTVTIANAIDDVGTSSAVGSGALINDPTPILNGTLSAALAAGQVLAVYRDGQRVAQLSPTATSWSLTDTGAADGTHNYFAQVEDSSGHAGSASAAFSLTLDTAAPGQQVAISKAFDNAGASTGSLVSGSKTDDTSPLLQGSLSAPLAAGEVLNVFRDGVRLGAATVSSSDWSFADSNVTPGAHSYTALVQDAAGNSGITSNSFLLSVEALNRLTGTTRSDNLVGTIGADVISGVPDGGTNLGKGSVDVLTGNGGSDLFDLGDARGRFYDDGKGNSSGTGDYARIVDFSGDDHIQLSGSARSYLQQPLTLNGFSGTGIYHDGNGNGFFDSKDELIALVQNHGVLDSSSFIFV